jgi:hypothetical protein
MAEKNPFCYNSSDILIPTWGKRSVSNMLSHPHPKQTNMIQHNFTEKSNTYPKQTATGKQPKQKNQTPT